MVGVLWGFACFPVALATLALVLVQAGGLSLAVGFAVAVALGAAVRAALACWGWKRIRKHGSVLRRSQRELTRNLQWLKDASGRNRIARSGSMEDLGRNSL